MAEIYLDPQSDGLVVVTKAGRTIFPAGSDVSEIMDHLLAVAKGKGTPPVNSIGTGQPAPPIMGPAHGNENVIVRRVKPDPKLRGKVTKTTRVTLTLEQLLSTEDFPS